ncbi:MAG: carboxypeptidase-like regulatory domain-containing protein, partial [Bacteroidales bacterium]
MKKKSFRPIDLKQIFRVMKLSFVLSVLFVSSVFAADIEAQNQKVTIAKKQMTTISLLNKIEQQTDYLFVYKKDEIDLNQKVYTKADNISVAQVLNAAFKNTDITYSMEGKNIMLMKNPSITPNTVNQDNVVKGIILDKMGIPVIGASIIVVGTLNGTTSDANGKFEINTSSNSKLEISFIGYSTQIINVDNKNDLSITLFEDAQVLNDVVVVGFGTQKKINLTGSVAVVDDKEISSRPISN